MLLELVTAMLIGPRGFGTRDASTLTWRLVAPRTDSIGVAPACCAVSASSRALRVPATPISSAMARISSICWPAASMEPALRMALTMCAPSTPCDGGGVRHVKAETGGVDQRAELGERDAFDADGRRGGGTEPCRVRLEAEQVDGASGGGEQVSGHGGEHRVRRGDMVAQRGFERRIIGQISERNRPGCGLSAESERMRFAVEPTEKEIGV